MMFDCLFYIINQNRMKLSENVDYSKDKSTQTELSQKDDFNEQFTLKTQVVEHKRYGKMVVLLQTDRILITLGPDYLCFVITFSVFGLAGCLLTLMVNQAFDSLWIKVLNIVVVFTQLLSYLMVGLSNPGVALEQNLTYQQAISQVPSTKRYCLKCKIRMQRYMHHCSRCDVCIRGYDHHCPWVSKCIGASNLKRFYFFVGFTPFYIIYFMIMLLISLAVNVSKQTINP